MTPKACLKDNAHFEVHDILKYSRIGCLQIIDDLHQKETPDAASLPRRNVIHLTA